MININDTVYVIFQGEIYKLKVFAVGEESFVHSEAFEPSVKEEYRQPLLYIDEGITWTRTLEEAKAIIGE